MKVRANIRVIPKAVTLKIKQYGPDYPPDVWILERKGNAEQSVCSVSFDPPMSVNLAQVSAVYVDVDLEEFSIHDLELQIARDLALQNDKMTRELNLAVKQKDYWFSRFNWLSGAIKRLPEIRDAIDAALEQIPKEEDAALEPFPGDE